MRYRDIIDFQLSLIFVLLLSAFLSNVLPKEIAFSQTRAECNPEYGECISSCGKQNNSCYDGAGTDTDQIARCDDQYTACNESCFAKFCREVHEEKK